MGIFRVIDLDYGYARAGVAVSVLFFKDYVMPGELLKEVRRFWKCGREKSAGHLNARVSEGRVGPILRRERPPHTLPSLRQ